MPAPPKDASSSPAGEPGRTVSPVTAGALSAVFPGVGQYVAGERNRAYFFGGVTLLWVIALGMTAAANPVAMLQLAFNELVLLLLHGVNIAWLVWRALAAFDAYLIAAARRPGHSSVVTGLGIVGIVLALVVPHAAFGYYDHVQYDLIRTVFDGPATGSGPVAGPAGATPQVDATEQLAEAPEALSQTRDEAEASPPERESPQWDGDERLNILLLGSDAGVGRSGVRTDTMVVVSVHPSTGDAAVFGIPRNFAEVPLADGHGDGNCDCFPDILNALYRYAEGHPASFPGPSGPGPNAIKGAIGELLGIEIHYYALVALDGFVDIVDALGGVTLNVAERIYDPDYPNEDGTFTEVEIPAGVHRFNGHGALIFARSRWASDDYDRMARQRCVIEAVVEQADPVTLLRAFPSIADAIKRSVETDIPLERIRDLLGIVPLVSVDEIVGIGFVPPTYSSGRTADRYPTPDVRLIHEHVDIVMELPAAEAIATLGLESLDASCG
jgi:LCP family protein required for cell wall assembly